MFKKFVLIIVLVSLCSCLFALDMSNAEPYDKNNFPKWALDLRRAEIIMIGSIPVTYGLTSLIANTAMNKNLTFWQTAGIACSVSAVIVLTDFVLGLVSE